MGLDRQQSSRGHGVRRAILLRPRLPFNRTQLLQPLLLLLLSLLSLSAPAAAMDNGLALLPPMGWRSWNAFGISVNQSLMETTMDAMADRSRQLHPRDLGVYTAATGPTTTTTPSDLSIDDPATDEPTTAARRRHDTTTSSNRSLLDLGFANCGLDDGWQRCGAGAFGSFHDAHGNPVVDLARFPDLHAMTDHAHALGLRAGWYANNCECKELSCKYQPPPCWAGAANLTKHMEGTVRAVVGYGFDGVKLDGCGQFRNLTWWAELLNATGRPVLVENCHGPPFPTAPNDTTVRVWIRSTTVVLCAGSDSAVLVVTVVCESGV